MTGKLVIIFVIALRLVVVPVHAYGLDLIDNNEKSELVKTWKTFLKAISAHDMKQLKQLSHEKIRCLTCLDNTEEENQAMTHYMVTDPDWYDKLYKERIFVPIDTFCREDYPILFSKKFIKKLLNTKPAYAAEDFDSKKIYEVIITTAKPGEIAPGHQGVLHLFQFIKTSNGYKFWGIDTIP